MRAEWRDRFIADAARAGIYVEDARKFLRYAASLQRIAELQCSSEAYDRDRVLCPGDPKSRPIKGVGCLCDMYKGEHTDIPRGDIREARIQARVRKLADSIMTPRGPWRATFQGDPRGCVVKLIPPGVEFDEAKGIDCGSLGVPA